MSPRLDRSNGYWQGIRQAEQGGLITYARNVVDGRHAISDDYSHLGHGDGPSLSLKFTNTRPLASLAKQILNLYRSEPRVRFLELGPGAGAACAAVNRLLPDAEIDTVSLTPLNPYLRFRWDDMYDHMARPSSHEPSVSFLCEQCSLPFVRKQYIGRFPCEISPAANSYHFIYEHHGALFYNFDPGLSKMTELARDSLSAALSLLRPDGTMVIMASDGSYRIEEALESMTSDADVVVTCKRTTGYHSFPCFVARKESPISARLRESRSGLVRRSARVVRLESSAFEDVISKLCTL